MLRVKLSTLLTSNHWSARNMLTHSRLQEHFWCIEFTRSWTSFGSVLCSGLSCNVFFIFVFSSNTFAHFATRSKTTKMWKPRECQCQCECQLQLQMSDVFFKCKCQIVQKKKKHPSRYGWRTTKVTEQMPLHVHRHMFLQQPMQWQWQWQWSLVRSTICPESQGACALAHSLLGEFSRIMLEVFSRCFLCKHRAASNEFGMFLLWKMVTRFTHVFRLREKMCCLSSAP